ncbi:unnamed protein product [Rotaria sp. Silwood2]|nr:unnamed protein product [Rotaria sp. Silwood2]
MDGIYTIECNSDIDTSGFIYNNSFDPVYSILNLLANDDDSGGDNQFLFSIFLQAQTRYILVVTTYNEYDTGPFLIIATGLASIIFSQINVSNTSLSVISRYSSQLTNTSQHFCRTSTCSTPSYYYQALLINVSIAGSYYIMSNSSLDTYGYIYNNSFNSSAPRTNLIVQNDDDGDNAQFLLTLFIDTLEKYILIVTTYAPNVFGTFSINTVSVGSISFSRV